MPTWYEGKQGLGFGIQSGFNINPKHSFFLTAAFDVSMGQKT